MNYMSCLCNGSPLCGHSWNCKKYIKAGQQMSENDLVYTNAPIRGEKCEEYIPIKNKFTEEDGWLVK